MEDEQKSFWTSLSGILTGLGAFITAITGLYLAISGHHSSQPTSVEAPQKSIVSPQEGTPLKEDKPTKQLIPQQEQIFNKKAVIDDPDGFTYIRSMKSTSGNVVATVYNNEVFYTFIQDGNWWQVKTISGKIGYMHVSRIKLKD